MMKKTALVTGANRGLGLALSIELLERGYEVIAVCRRSSSLLGSIGALVVDAIDLTKPKDIASLSQRISLDRLDMLISNAGLGLDDSFETASYDGIQEQFTVNALAPLLLTQVLSPFLKEQSKIALITSRFGSLSNNDAGKSYAYRMSKAALNMLGKNLSIDLKERGIAVGIYSPGQVDTDMLRDLGITTGSNPLEAARNLINLIERLSLSNTGTYWHIDGSIVPW